MRGMGRGCTGANSKSKFFRIMVGLLDLEWGWVGAIGNADRF